MPPSWFHQHKWHVVHQDTDRWDWIHDNRYTTKRLYISLHKNYWDDRCPDLWWKTACHCQMTKRAINEGLSTYWWDNYLPPMWAASVAFKLCLLCILQLPRILNRFIAILFSLHVQYERKAGSSHIVEYTRSFDSQEFRLQKRSEVILQRVKKVSGLTRTDTRSVSLNISTILQKSDGETCTDWRRSKQTTRVCILPSHSLSLPQLTWQKKLL